MTDKLTRREREQIIFNHLKGKPNPLYEVHETKHGKYVVKPKQIQIEEEEAINEEPEPTKPIKERDERPKRNQRAKQDARRILEALTSIINSNESSDESSDDDDIPRAPPLIEPTNFNPQPQLTYRRRRLAF